MRLSLILFAFIFFGSIAYAEEIRITEDNIPFLYEARAEIPASSERLASIISLEYRKAKEEFTKHDLLQTIKPVLDKRLKESKQIHDVLLNVRGELGDYDFEKQLFPTGVDKNIYIPFKKGNFFSRSDRYAVTFENADKVSFLKVPLDKARTLSDSLKENRYIAMAFHCTIMEAKEQTLSNNDFKILQVKINKLDVNLTSGELVGSVSP